jgi:hypothetical protein
MSTQALNRLVPIKFSELVDSTDIIANDIKKQRRGTHLHDGRLEDTIVQMLAFLGESTTADLKRSLMFPASRNIREP